MNNLIYHNVIEVNPSLHNSKYYIVYEKDKNIVTMIHNDDVCNISIVFKGLEYNTEYLESKILTPFQRNYYMHICDEYNGPVSTIGDNYLDFYYNKIVSIYKRLNKLRKIITW